MKKLTTKRSNQKLLITSILTLVLTLIFVFAMVIPNVNKMLENYNNSSYIINSNYDFAINGPSLAQREELNNNKDVEKVVPYFNGSMAFDSEGKNKTIEVYAFNNEDNLDYTPFVAKRVVDSINVTNKDQIYIDLNLSRLGGYELGDVVVAWFRGLRKEYTITRIYETIPNYPQGYAVTIFKDTDFSKDIFNFAYIKAKNLQEVDKALMTYQPLANKKSRDEFESDASYEYYLQNFNSQNYYQRIDKNGLLKNNEIKNYTEANNVSKRNIIIAITIIVALILIAIIIENILLKKKINKEEISLGVSKKQLLISSGIMAFVTGAIIMIVAGLIIGLSKYNVIYALNSVIMTGVIAFVIGGIISMVFTFIIDAIFINGFYKKHTELIKN